MQEKKKSPNDKMDETRKAEINNNKFKLRQIAREKGREVVIMVAQGKITDEISQTKYNEITNLYKKILESDDLSQFDMEDFYNVLEQEPLLEKFAFRK